MFDGLTLNFSQAQLFYRKQTLMNFLLPALLSIQIMALFVTTHPEESTTRLFDFTQDSDIKNWRIVNDDVMGGISTSSFGLSDSGHGIFMGKVSTDNNGGFASVRYTMKKFKCENLKTIKIRLKGDGKDYQFRIKNKSADYFSYITTFSTSGEWETVEMNLEDFYPSFRGRKLDQPNFNKSSIEQVSILIANKKNETFKLEIDNIELY
jgi:hypothetical protein